LKDLEDVYQLVGNKVHELIGDGYIIVSALDEPSQAIHTKGLFGFGEIYDRFVKQFQIDPSQMAYPLKAMTPVELRLFRSGSVEKFPGGLYRLMLGKVPKSICKFAEKQLGISEIYTIGFIHHNVHFGGLSVLAKKEISFYEPYIKMILSQASIAIDRIKSALELRESEERFRSLYENATVGMYRTSPEGRILMANPALVKMLGYPTFEELAKRDLNQEGFEPGYPRQIYINQIQQKDELQGIESAWKRRDGSAIFVRESAKAIRTQNGNVLFYEGTVENIDERHQSEIALRESEAHFHGLFENSPISLWEEDFSEVKKRLDVLKKRGITDFHGYLSSHPKEIAHLVSLIKVLDVNQATLRLFNAKQKCDLLKPLTAVLSPQTLFEFQKELNSIAEGKVYFTWETKNQKLTSETIDVNLSWSVIPGHESDLSRVLISMIDITERHQAENDLRENEERFRHISSTTSDISYSCKAIQGKDYSIDWMIGATESIIGYSVDEIKAHGCWKFMVLPEDLALFEKHTIGLALGSYSSCELRLRHKNGNIVTVESFAECVSDNKDPKLHYLYGGLVNISERKREQKALQESEVRFRSLFEDSPIALWEEDHSEVKNYLNGLKKKGIRNYREYFRNHPQEVKKCLGLIKILNINNSVLKLYNAKNKSEVFTSLAPIFSETALIQYAEQLAQIASGKKVIEQETEAVKLSGEKMTHLVRLQVAPGFENSLARVIISVIDITDRKKAEQSLIKHAHLQEDMAVLGRALSTTFELTDIYHFTHNHLKNMIDCPNVGITLFDPFKEELKAAYLCSDGVELDVNLLPPLKYNPDRTSSGRSRAIATQLPVIVHDLENKRKASGGMLVGSSQEPKSAIYVPMIVERKVIGLLDLQSYQHDAYSEEDGKWLSVIANQIGLNIQNASLYQSLQIELKERTSAEERQRLLTEKERSQRVFSEALTKNALSLNSSLKTEELLDSIINNIQNVIPFEAASIIMIENGHGKIARSIGFAEKGYSSYLEQNIFDYSKYPSIQEMINSGLYVLIPDTQTSSTWVHDNKVPWKILSCVEAPIKEDDKVIGFVTLNSSKSNFYTEEHAHQLTAFTDQVSIAMKNTRLFEDTQRRMKRMNAMTLIDQAINSSLDINVSLEVVLMQALEQLGVDASDILLVNHVSNSLTFAKARGFKTSEITKSKLSLGAGLSGQAIMERRIVAIPDLKSTPESYFRNLLIEKEGFVSYYCVPLITKGLIKGVMEVYFRRPFNADAEWMEFLEMLAQQSAIAINNAELLNSLQISNNDLKNAYDSTLQGWVEALDLRDKENDGHSLRVTDATLRLAIHFNFEDKEMTGIKRGALLHDIGKISISDTILNKPGPLSDEEWIIMRKHPEFAFQLLSKTRYLRDALVIPYCHHEKWDGSGYPRGLKGEAIPLAARIFAIVDVWDALISDRPYRSAWSREKALEYIQAQSGKHFDPQVVKVFVEYLKSIHFKT
jgi:PAS domain S-box-containing protein